MPRAHSLLRSTPCTLALTLLLQGCAATDAAKAPSTDPSRQPAPAPAPLASQTAEGPSAKGESKHVRVQDRTLVITKSDCAMLNLSTRAIPPVEDDTDPPPQPAPYVYSFCLSKGKAPEGRLWIEADGTLTLESGDLFIASRLMVSRIHPNFIPYFYPLVKAQKVSAGSTLTEWIISIEPSGTVTDRGDAAVVQLRSACAGTEQPPCGVVVGHADHVGASERRRALSDGDVVYGELNDQAFGKERLDPNHDRARRFDELDRTARSYGVHD